MQTIRILADDLTGALDTAGCFATTSSPLPMVFDPTLLPQVKSWAASTASRIAGKGVASERSLIEAIEYASIDSNECVINARARD